MSSVTGTAWGSMINYVAATMGGDYRFDMSSMNVDISNAMFLGAYYSSF